MRRWVSILGAGLLYGLALSAQASCGSSYCSLNTTWDEQGLLSATGTRLDLRFEFIPQTQLRSGSHKVGIGEIPTDHDEVKTYNRNWLATLQHALDDNWAVAVAVPFTDRFHEHLNNGTTPPTPEQWRFGELGDVQLAVRYHPTLVAGAADGYGVRLGVKLPTGSIDVTNSDGTRAERSLQPGTGSTDAILGAFYHYRPADPNWLLFAQASWQSAFLTRDQYRPGNKLGLDVGASFTWSPKVTAMLQLNLLRKSRDGGANAEPDSSGGRFVYLSPGISVAINRDIRMYGFYQKPIYQYVNGVQLTNNWSMVLGASVQF